LRSWHVVVPGVWAWGHRTVVPIDSASPLRSATSSFMRSRRCDPPPSAPTRNNPPGSAGSTTRPRPSTPPPTHDSSGEVMGDLHQDGRRHVIARCRQGFRRGNTLARTPLVSSMLRQSLPEHMHQRYWAGRRHSRTRLLPMPHRTRCPTALRRPCLAAISTKWPSQMSADSARRVAVVL